MNGEFVRFAVAGGTAAIVNIGSRWLMSGFLRFDVAVVIAYLIGMTTAYLLNRQFVFEKSGRVVHNEATRFAIVNLVSLAQVWLVSVSLAQWFFPRIGFMWHAELIAHVIAVASPILTSYYAHKYFTFR